MMFFDNTRQVKQNAKYIRLETPCGNESQEFQEGETVSCTASGKYRAGVAFEIVEAYPQNGYWYYRDDCGLIHRQKDLLRQ